jgi:hypothetical protein
MIDQKTVNREYPLPHADNKLREDVVRLNDAFVDIDTDVNDLYATTGTLSTQVTSLTQDTQNGSLLYANSTGDGVSYEVVLNPTPTALNAGLLIHMKAHAQNTGPATLNINSLGIKTIKKTNGSDLKAGDMLSGSFCFLVYDGINFQLINPKVDQAQTELNTSNIMRAFEEIQENHGGSLLMEAGWSDSFSNANEQGSDEGNSIGFQHDPTNTLYKGNDPGIGLNADHDYINEDDYTTHEETGTTATISSDTVTIATGSFGSNVVEARFSPENPFNPANSAKIITRTDSTHVELESGHGLTASSSAWAIRFFEINSGVVQLSSNDSGGYGPDISSGQTYSASTSHSISSPAGAFDNNLSASTNASLWLASANNGWIKIDFGSGITKTVIKYTIVGWNSGGGRSLGDAPKTWTFEGSNNDSDWTVLDTHSNITSWAVAEKKEYMFSNSTGYRYYRWNITANNGNSYLNAQELEVMEAANACAINEHIPIIPNTNQLTSASSWTVENTASHTQTETLNSASVFYFEIFETNGYGAGTIFKITDGSDNVRSIVQYDGTNWQYNSNVTFGSTTWTNSTVNNMYQAVRDAMGVSANLYTGTSRNSATAALYDTGFSRGVGIVLYSTNQSNNPSVDQTRINFDSMRGAMDLRSKTYDPGFEPSEGYVWSRIEHSDSDGPGTFYATRNGGTEWAVVPMVQQGPPLSGDIRIYRGTVDVNSQASGQDLRCRYQSSQGKDQFLHSWGLQAKP